MAQDDASGATKTRVGLVCLTLVCMQLVLVVGSIFAGFADDRSKSDQDKYHLIVVREFVEDWPAPSMVDYRSATTPGYHLVLAAVSGFVGDDVRELQLIGSVFSIALALVVGGWVGSRVGFAQAVGLGGCVLASPYVWSSGVTLLPDNAGWVGAAAVLALCLRRRGGVEPLIAAGFCLALLVFVRQSHLWAAAVVWTAGWFTLRDDDEDEEFPTVRGEIAALTSGMGLRLTGAGIGVLCTVPAVLLVAWFVRLWGGLTPPLFAETTAEQIGHQGPNPAGPAFVLSVFGLVSLVGIGYLLPTVVRTVRERVWILAIGGVVGFVVGLAPASSFAMEEGRWGGALWEVARRAPVVADRSVVVVACSTLGGAMAAVWWLALGRRDRWLLLGALVAFTAAQTANLQQWQRYVEPMSLLFVALFAPLVRLEGGRVSDALRVVMPYVAVAALLGMTAMKVWG